jgi:hypothetical protein
VAGGPAQGTSWRRERFVARVDVRLVARVARGRLVGGGVPVVGMAFDGAVVLAVRFRDRAVERFERCRQVRAGELA